MLRKICSFRFLGFALYVGWAIGLSMAVSRGALETVQMPFAGILPYANLYVGAFTQPHWSGGENRLRLHDRVVALDGEPVPDSRAFLEKVAWAEEEGRPAMNATIARGHERFQSHLDVGRLDPKDIFLIFGPLFITGLAFFLIGALAFVIRPLPPGVLSFWIYCLTAGTYLLTAYDFHTTYRFIPILLTAFAFIPASVVHLAFTFPRPIVEPKVSRVTLLAPYLMSALLLVGYLLFFERDPRTWAVFESSFFFYLSLAYLGWLGNMLYRALRDRDVRIREQCRVILVALIPAFGTIFVLGWMVFVFGSTVPLTTAVPFAILFPLAVLYGMLRRNLFLVDHLEARVRERTEALQRTQSELGEAKKMAAVGVLAAGTAHEIGNAMNLISSNLPVLRRYAERLLSLAENDAAPAEIPRLKTEMDFDYVRSDLPDLLGNLEKGSERAIRIVQDLKSFARPPSAKKEALDLGSLVESTLRLLKPELKERIEVEKDIGEVPSIVGSRDQLQQVIVNLLLNAVQAIEGTGTIRVELHSAADHLILSVRDSGRGIPKELLSRVFEPFFTTKQSGTGMGLSVSYGIVKDHGGTLRLESEMGHGTNAVMELPLEAKT
ncbi:MAG: ATP-binding protein [Pseudomonadota bacterium]